MNKSKSVNTFNSNLSEWCSLWLSHNIEKQNSADLIRNEIFLAKKIYYNYLEYKAWKNLKKKFIDYCFNSTTKFVYINNEKYNYNFVEYMCYQQKNNQFSVLDFCSAIGIFIPHYCYHPDLSIAGNCRMCLIQLDGAAKPIASCAIVMSSNMILNTQSIFVKKIQEEFLNFYF